MMQPMHWTSHIQQGNLTLKNTQGTENAGIKDQFVNHDLFYFESQKKLRLTYVQLFWPVLRQPWHSANSRFVATLWLSPMYLTNSPSHPNSIFSFFTNSHNCFSFTFCYQIRVLFPLAVQQCTWSILHLFSYFDSLFHIWMSFQCQLAHHFKSKTTKLWADRVK